MAVVIRDVDTPSAGECATFLRSLTPAALAALSWQGVTAQKSDGSAGVADQGATQYLQLQGLALHQRYCFAIRAADFAGNTASIQSTPPSNRVVRYLPLAGSASLPFSRAASDRPDDTLQPPLASFSSIAGFPGTGVVSLGDMDGDGRLCQRLRWSSLYF